MPTLSARVQAKWSEVRNRPMIGIVTARRPPLLMITAHKAPFVVQSTGSDTIVQCDGTFLGGCSDSGFTAVSAAAD